MSLGGNSREDIHLISPLNEDSFIEDSLIIEEIKEKVFEEDINDELSTVEGFIQALFPGTEGNEAEEFGFLKSLWNYFYASRLIREERDFSRACSIAEEAAREFEKADQYELTSLSEGLSIYANAASELGKMNVNGALELLNSAADYIDKAGQYGNSLQTLMDNTKHELLFEAATKAMQAADFSTAKILTEEACEASKSIAKNYHEDGTPLYFTYQGMASFYKASFVLNLASNELNNFEYEKLSGKNLLAESAIEAWDFLRQGDLKDINIGVYLQISKAFIETLEVIEELAEIMLYVRRSPVKINISKLRNLREKICEAISSVSGAGPQAVTYVRLCENLHTKIKNLERLVKSSKKDFVVHLCMTSAVLFIPLFIIASWVNSAYDVGAGGPTLFGLCICAALIAGFGYSTLKLKTALFSGRFRFDSNSKKTADTQA